MGRARYRHGDGRGVERADAEPGEIGHQRLGLAEREVAVELQPVGGEREGIGAASSSSGGQAPEGGGDGAEGEPAGGGLGHGAERASGRLGGGVDGAAAVLKVEPP